MVVWAAPTPPWISLLLHPRRFPALSGQGHCQERDEKALVPERNGSLLRARQIFTNLLSQKGESRSRSTPVPVVRPYRILHPKPGSPATAAAARTRQPVAPRSARNTTSARARALVSCSSRFCASPRRLGAQPGFHQRGLASSFFIAIPRRWMPWLMTSSEE